MRDIKQLSHFAVQLADAARALIVPQFRANLSPESKSDNSPVTIADRAAEKKMREMINKNYPTHGIIGEEFGEDKTDADMVWVLDPIDGTRSFITGSQMFCTLIALVVAGKPVIGIIDMPMLNERWLGIRQSENNGCQNANDYAAFFNGKQCRVSNTGDLQKATIISTTYGQGDNNENEFLKRLSAKAGYLRLGGDGGAYGCVASGFADIAADMQMHLHDYLALVPVVRGGGGIISDWQGNENLHIQSGKTTIIAAATNKLHKAALQQ